MHFLSEPKGCYHQLTENFGSNDDQSPEARHWLTSREMFEGWLQRQGQSHQRGDAQLPTHNVFSLPPSCFTVCPSLFSFSEHTVIFSKERAWGENSMLYRSCPSGTKVRLLIKKTCAQSGFFQYNCISLLHKKECAHWGNKGQPNICKENHVVPISYITIVELTYHHPGLAMETLLCLQTWQAVH